MNVRCQRMVVPLMVERQEWLAKWRANSYKQTRVLEKS